MEGLITEYKRVGSISYAKGDNFEYKRVGETTSLVFNYNGKKFSRRYIRQVIKYLKDL